MPLKTALPRTMVYDELGAESAHAREGSMSTSKTRRTDAFAAAVGRALRRAGTAARKTARLHKTPIYVWKNGKVVAEKP